VAAFWRQEDLWLKLVSLLVALVVWVYVASRTTPPSEVGWRMSVPLEVRGLPSGLEVAGLPPTIDVSLVAPPGQEEKVKGQVRAILSLSGLGQGNHRLAVRVPQPSVGRVVGVSPRWIQVQLGQSGTRRQGVTVELVGVLAHGFRASAPQVTPAEVSLTGVEGLLAEVASVQARVEIDGAASEVRMTVSATPVDARGKPVGGVTVEPAEVEVVVPVAPEGVGAAGPSAP
jgi:YbbR domain-containing protein